jgi:hypothetical protein
LRQRRRLRARRRACGQLFARRPAFLGIASLSNGLELLLDF